MTPPTPTLLLARIRVGKRFRKNLGNIDDLVQSIREVGLLHPIVVDAGGNLIAGERRVAACLRLGWKDIPATIVELDDAGKLRAEHDENTIRQSFTPSEAVAIAAAIKNWVKTPVGQHADQRDSESCAISGRTIDKAAEFVGMSGRTLEKATAVVEAAAADPELAPVVEEMDRTGKVDPAYRKVAPTKPQAHSASGPADDPTGLPEHGRRMSKAPEDVFARVVDALVLNVDFLVSTVDIGDIAATPTQLRKLAHVLHALGKVRRTVEQNARRAPAFGTGSAPTAPPTTTCRSDGR